MSEEQATERKRKPRLVFGRLKGIEHAGSLWTVALTKAGVQVRRRWAKKSDVHTLPLGAIVNLAMREPELIPPVKGASHD